MTFRLQIRLAAVGLALLLPGAGRGVAQAMPAALVGGWRIERILLTAPRACWDESRAGTLVGSTLHYRQGALEWKGGSVPVPEALSRTLTPKQFQNEYRFDPGALGIHAARVTEIDLQHEDADVTGATTEVPGDTVLLAGPGRIVVSACGVFFAAVRAGR